MNGIFKCLRRSAIAAAVATGFAGTAPQANALVILGLGIDGSGSISAADFTLQQNAYVNAINAVLPTDGSVAVGVWLFSSAVSRQFDVTLIDSVAAKTALTAAIGAMVQPGGLTALAQAITDAAGPVADGIVFYSNNSGNGTGPDKLVIDISTDGFDTVNGNAATVAAALAAVAAGVDQVNCLGVGGGANCGFIAGVGSFAVAVSDFAGFESALIAKLAQETGRIPEPASLAVFGFGLAGLGLLRRRRRAA